MNEVEHVHAIEQAICDDDFQEMLDDNYGDLDVCGLKMGAGYILREMDPIAFSCKKIDYEDTLPYKWECAECGTVYDYEEDAETCCEDSWETNDQDPLLESAGY